MLPETILAMIEDNKIEELKFSLKEEIYTKSINTISGANARFKAMKRFVKYNLLPNTKKHLKLPIAIDGDYYFTNGYCIVETTENVGSIPFSTEENADVDNMVKQMNSQSELRNEILKINFKEILSKAKMLGYRFSKKALEMQPESIHIFKLRDMYVNMSLLDYAYSIIDDGDDAEVEYRGGSKGMLISTSVGRALILPVRMKNLSAVTTLVVADNTERSE